MIGSAITYDNLDIEIRPAQGQDYAFSVRSRAGEAEGIFRVPYDSSALEIARLNLKLALRQAGSFRQVISPEQQKVQELGAALFDALMVGEARSRYDLSRDKAEQEERRLRIRLHIAAPELAVLPWEYLYDRREDGYLSLSTRTPVVRYLKLPRPPRPLDVTPPLRILGLSACPVNLPRLDLAQEHQRMETALAGLIQKDYFNLHWAEDRTCHGLQKILRSGPWHIFHFFGHGDFDREKDEGFIALEDEQHEAKRLYASQLGQMLADHPTLRLAFLNACGGAEGGTHDIFSSTASILIQKGLPAVLAMQDKISDRAAIELASTFYEALADGYPIDAALAEARKAVYIALPSSMEWGVPTLHLRAPNGDLFHLEGEPSFSVKAPQVGTRLVLGYGAESRPTAASILARPGSPTRGAPTLSGCFVSPILAWQAIERRIGRGDIRQVIPMPNRRAIVIAGGGAAMFDLRTGQAYWEIDAPSIRGTLSPDGRILALAAGPVIELWDLATGICARVLTGHTDWVRSMAFSSDMRLLASGGSDSTVRIWDLQHHTLLHTLTGHSSWVSSVIFSPDGHTVASAGEDQVIRFWDIDHGILSRTLKGHQDHIKSLAFSPDGRILASGSHDHTVCLWNFGWGTLLRRWDKHQRPVYSIAFKPDGRMLASGSEDGAVYLWNVERSEPVRMLQEHTGRVPSVAFSPDEDTLLSASFDGTVRLWDIQRGISLHTMANHSLGVRSIVFSPDGHTLVSGSTDGVIRLWRIGDGALIRAIPGRAGVVASLAFSPDGRAIASSGDGVVRLWDALTGAAQCSLEGHAGQVNSVAFSPDGTVLASGGSDSVVRLWNVPDGTLVNTWYGHTGGARSVAFSPDGHILAADHASAVCFWDMASAQVLRSLEKHTGWINSIAFSPDGHLVASGSDDQTVCLWNLDTGAVVHTCKGHTNWICCAAFSPDGRILASGSADGTVCLWNVVSGTLLHTIEGHSRPVRGVAFHPDGHLLATASDDGIIRLWRTD